MLSKTAPYFIIILLALVSYKVVDIRTLSKENINYRSNVQTSILKGEVPAYNQHGIFTVASIYVLQKAMYAVFHNSQRAYSYAVQLFNIIIFLIIFWVFYKFLRIFFNDSFSVLGILLLGVSVQLAVSGAWPESDFANLALYIIGLLLIFNSKNLLLTLVFIIGVLNGLQILFLLIFYIIYLFTNQKLKTFKAYLTLIAIAALTLLTIYLIRIKFGIGPTNVKSNFDLNISDAGIVLQLWLAEFVILFFITVKGFKYSTDFFRISLISLLVYLVLFMMYGKMNEPGKFLPALLILIPMSLSYLNRTMESESIVPPSNT